MLKIDSKGCSLKVTPIEITTKFLEDNNDQVNASSTYRYGLFYESELVQLMTFGKPRFNKNHQCEIIRECTKKEHKVYRGKGNTA